MEKSCYKCGQVMEEGRPFCPHCAAPQIRVLIAEPVAASASLPEVARMQEASDALPASQTVPVLAVPMRWSQAVQPCAVAAAIAAVAIVFQLAVPLIAGLGSGFLAVALFRRRNPEIAMQAKIGARLGALCGGYCCGMTAVLAALRILILHDGGKVRAGVLDALQQQAVRYPDPQLQPTLEFLRSPAGLVFMGVFILIFMTFVFVLAGMLGGTLGGVLLRSRDRN